MAPGDAPLAVLIPAHNEAAYIGGCLRALLASDPPPGPVQVVVIANACTDGTADLAREFAPDAGTRGWDLQVIDTPQPGKLNALNLGERSLDAHIRVYLDADVRVSPPLLADLAERLDRAAPAYASGTPQVIAEGSALTRAYARFWRRLPFVESDVPGFGIFAVNRPGRARWGAFPDIIADDSFVRLHFAPDERHRVPATYTWPVVTRLRDLVRVRRRQNRGVTEISNDFPELQANESRHRPGPVGLIRRALRDPAGFAVYALVLGLTRLPAPGGTPRWARGR